MTKMKVWHAVTFVILIVAALYVYHMISSHKGESLNPIGK